MTALSTEDAGTDLVASAWQETPSWLGTWCSCTLYLPSRQRTRASCFSLVTGCGITFSSPWTNQANILVTRNHCQT